MNNSDLHDQPLEPRRCYQAPQLKCFGYVRELTAQGSSGSAESATGQSNMCGQQFRGTQGSGC